VALPGLPHSAHCSRQWLLHPVGCFQMPHQFIHPCLVPLLQFLQLPGSSSLTLPPASCRCGSAVALPSPNSMLPVAWKGACNATEAEETYSRLHQAWVENVSSPEQCCLTALVRCHCAGADTMHMTCWVNVNF
jgi:hypothetical protein